MSIVNFKEKIKSLYEQKLAGALSRINTYKMRQDVFTVLLIVLVAVGSFGLGKISTKEKKGDNNIEVFKTEDNLIFKDKVVENGIVNTASIENAKMLVASKNGTKYYFPWCSGANRIKDENKIWFSSYEEARARGLSPASGCQGLQ